MTPRDAASPHPSDSTARRYIEAITKAAKVPSRNRSEEIKPSVEAFSAHAYEQGVLPTDVDELVDLITTPSHLDQASLNSILKSLYPAAPVPTDAVAKIVGALGHGKLKPSFAIQGALLRWLIMVYHVIDSPALLSQLYGILFNLLDTAVIRTHVCHILALVTRRRHVRPFRIQYLLSLARQTGNDAALTGLLRVYKNYYPEIIVGEATRGKASAFAHPDSEWKDRLSEIQQAHAERVRQRSEQPLSSFQVFRSNGKAVLPEVHSSRATESWITLEEIESADGLVDKLEKLELPDQLVAVLGDPLLQKLFVLKPNDEARQRASLWLSSYAEDVLTGTASEDTSGIFQVLKSYLRASKSIPPVVIAFLSDYLQVWDGHSDREAILEILTYIPILNFADLLSAIFSRLEARLLNGTIRSQITVLKYYTSLFRRWKITLAVDDQNQTPEAAATLTALETRVGTLCLSLLQASPNSPEAASSVLNFYEETASLIQTPPFPLLRITIPPGPIVYLLAFHPLASVLARLCGILTRYKAGFSQAQQRKQIQPKGAAPRIAPKDSPPLYPSSYVDEFNGFLMDVCNLIWRSRAFNATDPNAHGCLLDSAVANDLAQYVRDNNTDDGPNNSLSLPALFSLSYSPVLGSVSASRIATMEDEDEQENGTELDVRHAGPVTKGSLAALARNGGLNTSWEDFRVEVLEELSERRGMGGVSDLLYSTMTTLAKNRA